MMVTTKYYKKYTHIINKWRNTGDHFMHHIRHGFPVTHKYFVNL